jgi:aspartate 1-decarboxylase
MRRIMLKSKIHRAFVTDSNLNYQGSITIDKDLMEAADMKHYEQVAVVNINNGARFETYVMEGVRGSGAMVLNGAAARLVHQGDRIIVFSYVSVDEDEADGWEAKIVLIGEENTDWHLAEKEEKL